MSEDANRRAELMGAALAGELTPRERAELDDLIVRDPSIIDEMSELGDLRDSVRAAGQDGLVWDDASPGDSLAQRMARAPEPDASPHTDEFGESRSDDSAPRQIRSTRPSLGRGVLRGLAAACLVAVGVGGTLGYQQLGSPADAVPTGPPGTLGAVEEVTFQDVPRSSSIDASLVAHTWGTETILEIDGLDVGDTYEVVLIARSGEELSSGTFIGTEATVECRMNAAITREQVAQIRIESQQNPSVHPVADLPAVSS